MYIFAKTASVFHQWKFVRDEFQEIYKKNGGDFSRFPHEVIWETRHKEVLKVQLPEEFGGGCIACKYYRNARPIRFFLQPSAAYREGRGFFIVRKLGIPLVETLALGEDRILGYLRSSFFISRFAEGYQSGRFLIHENMSELDQQNLKDFIRINLSYLARLHRAGFSHGGAHYDNFIWRMNDSGKIDVLWLDLATVKKMMPGWRHRKQKADLDMFLNCFMLTCREKQEYLEFYSQKYRDKGGKLQGR